jgi:hypothetical protein
MPPALVSDTRVGRGGRVRHVEVSDTVSIRCPLGPGVRVRALAMRRDALRGHTSLAS